MKRRLYMIVLATLVTLSIDSGAQARAIRNVLVVAGSTEPFIASNPTHPATAYVGTNPNYARLLNGKYPDGFYVYRHGTASAGLNPPLPDPYGAASDPTVQVAANGTVFFSYLGETIEQCGSVGHYAVFAAVKPPRSAGFTHVSMIDAGLNDDKPNMAIENIPGRQTHVFVAWSRGAADVYVARSIDGGFSFTAPQLAYHGKNWEYGVFLLAGPHHRAYLFWSDLQTTTVDVPGKDTLMMSTSTNDGATFGAPTAVATFESIPRRLPDGLLRVATQPWAAVTSTGRLYVTWPEMTGTQPNGQVTDNIMLATSRNGGRTWVRAQVVNDVTTGDRFMPAVTALPDGSAALLFYDRRLGPDDLNVYAAHAAFSAGHMRVSPNVKLNAGPAPIADMYTPAGSGKCFSPGRFFGDYISLTPAGPKSVYAVWTDTQLQRKYQTQIWLAKVVLPRVP